MSSGLDLKQVDAGGDAQIVGVNTADTIHCLKSKIASSYEEVGTVSWNDLPGSLMYFSCGSFGCWGVNKNFQIFFTVNSSFYLSTALIVSQLVGASHHGFWFVL